MKCVLASELSKPQRGDQTKVIVRSGVDLEVTSTLDQVDLHSTRLFCSGVPVSTTRLLVLTAFNALEIYDPSLRRMCPSSHTTKSGPENRKKSTNNGENESARLYIVFHVNQLYQGPPGRFSAPSSTLHYRPSWPKTGCGNYRSP